MNDVFDILLTGPAVFKGLALAITPSYYEQVTRILETAHPGPWFKHMYAFLKKKPSYGSLMYQELSNLTLHCAMIGNDMHYMNSVSSTAATKLLTSQYTVTCFSVPPFDQGLHSLERSLNNILGEVLEKSLIFFNFECSGLRRVF